jgi:hypothetical protein
VEINKAARTRLRLETLGDVTTNLLTVRKILQRRAGLMMIRRDEWQELVANLSDGER